MQAASISRTFCVAAALFTASASFTARAARAQSQQNPLPQQSAAAPQTSQSSSQIESELESMRKRIDELEAELKKSRASETAAASPATAPKAGAPAVAESSSSTKPNSPADSGASSAAALSSSPAAATDGEPAGPKKIDPFSDADWTWLNGNPRTKDIPWDSKFFTPEIRADINYVADFNHPTDHTISGSSELFRSGEVQLEQLGIGGDFHYDNVRARFMTQFGMYSVTTPRNDPSVGHGQWDLADAYRYISEAYGGYHFNVMNGVNVDAGIFMSYIGLFSYYNFDNWAYQPSFVSSNTPWFFQGVRVQVFPTAHLKIEPWFINGWQSYGVRQSSAGHWRADQMDAEAVAQHRLQQLRPRRRRSVHPIAPPRFTPTTVSR